MKGFFKGPQGKVIKVIFIVGGALALTMVIFDLFG